MARGDHIRVRRLGYWHHGIDCGDGQVIHYAGEPWRWRHAAVCRIPFVEFARGRAVELVEYSVCDTIEAVMRRAEGRLGETGYSLLMNNCEHFARWCKTGIQESAQVRRALRIAGGLCLAAMAVGGGIAVRVGRRYLDRRLMGRR